MLHRLLCRSGSCCRPILCSARWRRKSSRVCGSGGSPRPAGSTRSVWPVYPYSEGCGVEAAEYRMWVRAPEYVWPVDGVDYDQGGHRTVGEHGAGGGPRDPRRAPAVGLVATAAIRGPRPGPLRTPRAGLRGSPHRARRRWTGTAAWTRRDSPERGCACCAAAPKTSPHCSKGSTTPATASPATPDVVLAGIAPRHRRLAGQGSSMSAVQPVGCRP